MLPKDKPKDIIKHFKDAFFYCVGVFFYEGPDAKKNNAKGYIFLIPVLIALGIAGWLIFRLLAQILS